MSPYYNKWYNVMSDYNNITKPKNNKISYGVGLFYQRNLFSNNFNICFDASLAKILNSYLYNLHNINRNVVLNINKIEVGGGLSYGIKLDSINSLGLKFLYYPLNKSIYYNAVIFVNGNDNIEKSSYTNLYHKKPVSFSLIWETDINKLRLGLELQYLFNNEIWIPIPDVIFSEDRISVKLYIKLS